VELKHFFAILNPYGTEQGFFVQVYSAMLKIRFAGAIVAALAFSWPFTGSGGCLGPACVLWLSEFVFSSQTNYLVEEMACLAVSLPRYL